MMEFCFPKNINALSCLQIFHIISLMDVRGILCSHPLVLYLHATDSMVREAWNTGKGMRSCGLGWEARRRGQGRNCGRGSGRNKLVAGRRENAVREEILSLGMENSGLEEGGGRWRGTVVGGEVEATRRPYVSLVSWRRCEIRLQKMMFRVWEKFAL